MVSENPQSGRKPHSLGVLTYDAVLFRDEVNKDRSYLYLCTVEDNEEPFIADIRRIPHYYAMNPSAWGLMDALAADYWRGDKAPNPLLEVLAKPGTVKIATRADW